MQDKRERLRAALADLHAQLAEVDTLDPESRDLLQTIASDIQAALATPRSNPKPGEQSLSQRLTEATRQFEESHPTIGGVVERLVDVLAQMGI